MWTEVRTTSLRMTHCYASRTASGGATDADDFLDAIREQEACGKALHCTHGGADTGVESIDGKRIQQVELSLDHVEYGEDREACREMLAGSGVDRGRAG